MRKTDKAAIAILLASLVALACLAGCGSGTTSPSSEGARLLGQANDFYDTTMYTKAEKVYWQAETRLVKEKNSSEAKQAREKAQNCEIFRLTYPNSKAEVRKLLAKSFPDVAEAERNRWISSGELESMEIDRAPHYFTSVVENLKYRHLDLMRADPQMISTSEKALPGLIHNYIETGATTAYQPYTRPSSWKGDAKLKIPRDKLPKTGVFKLWFPMPIVTGPQDQVSLVSITPDTYVKQPPQDAADIGLAYMEVPLDKLEGNLDIAMTYLFTHYEQRFTVNPDNVGAYDRSDPDYQRYTASYGNIAITPEIRATADKVVGGEKNPWRAARKIYDYMLREIKYSFMPHQCLWPRGEAESVYVHARKRGDCGAQGIYFSALARAVGIPARCTGGYQLLSGEFSDHFWAEFFLPNYGWIPVDTSIAQIADYPPNLTSRERQTFKDYYFGNMDCFRCVVQTDVDVPLIPPAPEWVFLPMAIQEPAALCDTHEGVPGKLVYEGWSLHATSLAGPAPPF